MAVSVNLLIWEYESLAGHCGHVGCDHSVPVISSAIEVRRQDVHTDGAWVQAAVTFPDRREVTGRASRHTTQVKVAGGLGGHFFIGAILKSAAEAFGCSSFINTATSLGLSTCLDLTAFAMIYLSRYLGIAMMAVSKLTKGVIQ